MARLSFSVVNQDGLQALVPGLPNRLTVRITNTSKTALTLTPGRALSEERAADGPSSIYLSFGDVVGASATKGMRVAATGWDAAYFDAPVRCWALAPSPAAVRLPPDGTITVTVDAEIDDSARSGRLTIDFYNFGEAGSGSWSAPLPVRRSTGEPLRLGIGWRSGNWIQISRGAEFVPAALRLTISNPFHDRPLVRRAWGTSPPEFRLHVPTAAHPGHGAIVRPEELSHMQVQQADVRGMVWECVRERQDPRVFWSLFPKQTEVLGVGEHASVIFTIVLYCKLEPGTAVIHLEHRNIPGFEDGSVAIPVEKVLTPRIERFTVAPAAVDFDRGPVDVTVDWEVADAGVVLISGTGSAYGAPIPQWPKGSATVRLDAPRTFELLATTAPPSHIHAAALVTATTLASHVAGRAFAAGRDDTYRCTVGSQWEEGEVHLDESIRFDGPTATYAYRITGRSRIMSAPWSKLDEVNRSFTGSWRVAGGRIEILEPSGAIRTRLEFGLTDTGAPTLILVSQPYPTVKSRLCGDQQVRPGRMKKT